MTTAPTALRNEVARPHVSYLFYEPTLLLHVSVRRAVQEGPILVLSHGIVDEARPWVLDYTVSWRISGQRNYGARYAAFPQAVASAALDEDLGPLTSEVWASRLAAKTKDLVGHVRHCLAATADDAEAFGTSRDLCMLFSGTLSWNHTRPLSLRTSA